MSTIQLYSSFEILRPRMTRVTVVVAIHVLAVLALVYGDRVALQNSPQPVMLLVNVVPEIIKPPPPPPPPPPLAPRKTSKPGPSAPMAAAPPLRDIEVAPQTDIVATIVENAAPVAAAGGKPNGSGTAGAGDAGAGAGGANGGRVPIRVPAVLNPDNCPRPELSQFDKDRGVSGHVILAVMIDVDGKVTDARLARPSGKRVLDETALRSVLMCHFEAATVDRVAVPSWELFRFSWSIRGR